MRAGCERKSFTSPRYDAIVDESWKKQIGCHNLQTIVIFPQGNLAPQPRQLQDPFILPVWTGLFISKHNLQSQDLAERCFGSEIGLSRDRQRWYKVPVRHHPGGKPGYACYLTPKPETVRVCRKSGSAAETNAKRSSCTQGPGAAPMGMLLGKDWSVGLFMERIRGPWETYASIKGSPMGMAKEG